MPKFRKRRVVIDAVRFDNLNYAEVISFTQGTAIGPLLESETAYVAGQGAPIFSMSIQTKEGVMKAFPGDWVIKEPFPTGDRDFYPCKPDIFEKTYEAVDSTDGTEGEGLEIDVLEGNRLIAKFMGMSLSETMTSSGIDHEWIPAPKHSNWCFENAPPFNRSWGWLMPVVEKIARIPLQDARTNGETFYPRTFGMIADNGQIMVRLNSSVVLMGDTLLEATYKAVVDFIQWYNLQK